MPLHNNTKRCVCQEHIDKIEQEITAKFAPRRLQSELLANSYERLTLDKKAQRVRECGTFLEWSLPPEPAAGLHRGVPAAAPEQDKPRLSAANFCRDRLCPMCNWRRCHKIFSQVSRIQTVLSASDYDFVFVTLTVPNVDGSELSDEIDKMQAAWHKFIKYKRIQSAFVGYFKSLEVTRNNDKRSKSYGTYHPHYHIIFVVRKCYFTGRDFIKRDELLALWKRAKRDDRITQVDIRRVTDKQKQKELIIDGVKQKVDFTELGSAVAEIAKYAVKSSDFLGKMDKHGRIIVPLPEWLTDEIVSVYSVALAGRRLCAFGGVFEQVRKELNLDDPEDGDLIHEDGEQLNADMAIMVARYGWSCGAYKLIEIVPKKKSVICED